MHHESKIDELVSHLVFAGVISKCKRSWNFPLVVIGKNRLIPICGDFRRINVIIKNYTFPIPDIFQQFKCSQRFASSTKS